MEKKYRRCCGMDVHKETVVVCVLPPDGEAGKNLKKVYGTFHRDLGRMRGWLKQLKVTHIAMESTGVYWRPVWNVLEGHGFELLLANPTQVKALHGRKSDKRDCERIAQFLQDRRLDPSFVPPPEIRRLRDMLRHRLYLLEQRNETHNKIRDLFETAGFKFSSVTKLMSVSGQNIIEALIAGETSAEKLSWKIRGRLRPKQKQVRQAMVGYFDDFHRMMLGMLWKQYGFLTQQVADMEGKLKQAMEPYTELVELLKGVPGIDEMIAWTVIAELGTDMNVFPTAGHVCSWAGMCPGTNESAGKQISGKTRKGNRYIRRVLLEGAWAASRKKDSYLRAFFYRLQYRRGWGKAIVAVGHKLLTIIYGILKTRTPYYELGANYYDQLNPEKTIAKLTARLAKLGVEVVVQPKEVIS